MNTTSPLRIQQVLINLLASAAKYTNAGDSVWLAIAKSIEHPTIEVCANGIGIAPALLSQVFELFERGPQAPSQEYAGLSVGLALVKTLVESHGGNVTAHSDGLNGGVTFVVRLPSLPTSFRGMRATHPRLSDKYRTNFDVSCKSPMLDA